MISQLASSLVTFLLGWAYVSVGGLLSYLLLHQTRVVTPPRRTLVWGIYWSLCLLTLALHFSAIVFLLVCSIPFCCAGAFAENAIRPSEDWDDQLIFLVGTSFLSVGLGTWIMQWTETTRPLPGWVSYYPQDEFNAVFGMITTPAAISLFRWLLHSSHLRPGIDRPLNSDEQAPNIQRTKTHSND